MHGFMEVEDGEASLLRSLEEQLLRPEIRKSRERLNELLADGFAEFGSSGRVFDKTGIIERLPQEQYHPGAQAAETVIADFLVRRLAPQTLLVTYRLIVRDEGTEEPRHTLRSSIWQSIDNRWKMIFHQGTPAAPA
jgi:hypothetical protein